MQESSTIASAANPGSVADLDEVGRAQNRIDWEIGYPEHYATLPLGELIRGVERICQEEGVADHDLNQFLLDTLLEWRLVRVRHKQAPALSIGDAVMLIDNMTLCMEKSGYAWALISRLMDFLIEDAHELLLPEVKA